MHALHHFIIRLVFLNLLLGIDFVVVNLFFSEVVFDLDLVESPSVQLVLLVLQLVTDADD